eukprot:TRINITY_DN15887_c0_g1_i1.p1 TRINITY_DN15887_c0_g1~~TRINITY_DN15887_c0_g1_i1.p1  ORF type:complete len:406 (-),score=38.09 TRINITY_DN15887_c0_g1_i1:207-1376(-)
MYRSNETEPSHVDHLCDTICTQLPGLTYLNILAPQKSLTKRHVLKFLSSLQRLERLTLRNINSELEAGEVSTVDLVHPALVELPTIEIEGLRMVPRYLPRLEKLTRPCMFYPFSPTSIQFEFPPTNAETEIDSVKSCLRKPVQSVTLYNLGFDFCTLLVPNLLQMSFLKSLSLVGGESAQIPASRCDELLSHLPLLATFRMNVDIDTDELRSTSLWLKHHKLTDLWLSFESSSRQPSSFELTPDHLPSLINFNVEVIDDLEYLRMQDMPHLVQVDVKANPETTNVKVRTSVIVQNCPHLRDVLLCNFALGEVSLSSLPLLKTLNLWEILFDTATNVLQLQLPRLDNLTAELASKSDIVHFHQCLGSLIEATTKSIELDTALDEESDIID